MENYSFFKYIKIKEKEIKKKIKKKIKYLKNQIGGINTIDFTNIQMEVLKLKTKIDSIQSTKVNTVIDPLNDLKPLFNSINSSIQRLENKLRNNTEEQKRHKILNKIKNLEITTNSSLDDYTTIDTNFKSSYIDEQINFGQYDIIIKEVIDGCEKTIEAIKKNIKNLGNNLIKNEEIYTIIAIFTQKIKKYEKFLNTFQDLENTLNNIIKEIEEIFTVKIDKTTMCEIPDDDIIFNEDKINDKSKILNTKNEAFKIATTSNEIDTLLSGDFLKSQTTNYNEKSCIVEYHKKWKKRTQKYKSYLIEKYNNRFINQQEPYKNPIINHQEPYKKPIINQQDVPNISLKIIDNNNKANIFQLIEELTKYEQLVRKIKKIHITLNQCITLYNIRYSQFYNFQKYIVNYVSLKIINKNYNHIQYISKNDISFFDSLLTDLVKILDKFNHYSKLNNDDYKVLNQCHIKWFYGKHYFMIKILQNFFYELHKFWNDKQKKEINTDNKYWTLDKYIKTDKYNSKYFLLFNIFKDILMEYYMKLH